MQQPAVFDVSSGNIRTIYILRRTLPAAYGFCLICLWQSIPTPFTGISSGPCRFPSRNYRRRCRNSDSY